MLNEKEFFMFKVFIKKANNTFDRKKVFDNPFEAEGYFNDLCKERTDKPSLVIATNGNIVKKSFRIDKDFLDKARIISDSDSLL